MEETIYLDDPNLGALEKDYLNEVIDSGFVSTAGPFVPEFEANFAEYLKVSQAVSTQSGSAAIHIALHEAGIGPGDEVIVPALTFAATVFPVTYVGAYPVFVDVDLETWTLLPEAIEEALTARTKAIIPVHLYGSPCRMDEIVNIAKKYHLVVIEDATESLGTRYQDRYTGTFGDFGTFSFNGNKVITTGGGGMVVGQDVDRLQHIRFLVNQARDVSKGYYHTEIGFNYRMTNVEAALGLAQMKQLDGFLAKKREFHAIYLEELQQVPGIRFQKTPPGTDCAWWLTALLFEDVVDISALQQQLKHAGAPTRRIFVPVVKFPPFSQYKQAGFERSHYIYDRGLCLPSSTLNTRNAIYNVCRILKKALE